MAEPDLIKVLKTAATGWWNDNALRLAASLSYYTALSLAPLLLIVVAIAGVVFGRHAVGEQLSAQLGGLLGDDGRRMVDMILEQTGQPRRGLIAGIVGTVTLLLGATAVFGELQSAMNLVWKVQPGEDVGVIGGVWGWLRQRFLSLTMMLAVAFLLLVSLVISAVIAGLSTRLSGSDQTRVLFAQVVNQLVSIPVLTLLFALLFKFIPDAKVGWSEVWKGALLSALIFTLGKYLIGVYLGHASVGSAYGAAGSLIVFLVWVYFSALLLLFGAEFTHVYAQQSRGSK